jgi:hypothetical protein
VAKDRVSRLGRLICLCPVLAALGACSLFAGKSTPTEQCTGLMADAFPDDDIEITRKTVVHSSLTAQTVSIQGTRSDVPPTAALARDIAVECKFDHDVLTDFHWSKPPFR